MDKATAVKAAREIIDGTKTHSDYHTGRQRLVDMLGALGCHLADSSEYGTYGISKPQGDPYVHPGVTAAHALVSRGKVVQAGTFGSIKRFLERMDRQGLVQVTPAAAQGATPPDAPADEPDTKWRDDVTSSQNQGSGRSRGGDKKETPPDTRGTDEPLQGRKPSVDDIMDNWE